MEFVSIFFYFGGCFGVLELGIGRVDGVWVVWVEEWDVGWMGVEMWGSSGSGDSRSFSWIRVVMRVNVGVIVMGGRWVGFF